MKKLLNNRAEYIKQLKRLIKKYHPDLCTDEHLDSMYNEITKKLVNKLNELKLNENINIKNETVKINEQDYE
jgi:DnaJ-domain-containing protein 1